MTNYIWVTTQKELIHHYPDAPKDVEFLRNPHRHMFHFKIYLAIKHADRDIEFIKFKRWLESTLDFVASDIDNASCEMLAGTIAQQIKLDYPGRKIKIEVSEDGENGVLMEYD